MRPIVPGAAETAPSRIGERIKLVRKASGLSVRAFARDLNCDPTAISRFEAGKAPVSREIALTIAYRFGAGLDFLFFNRLDTLPAELRTKIERAASRESATPDRDE